MALPYNQLCILWPWEALIGASSWDVLNMYNNLLDVQHGKEMPWFILHMLIMIVEKGNEVICSVLI